MVFIDSDSVTVKAETVTCKIKCEGVGQHEIYYHLKKYLHYRGTEISRTGKAWQAGTVFYSGDRDSCNLECGKRQTED